MRHRIWASGYENIGDPPSIEKVFVAKTARKREKTAKIGKLWPIYILSSANSAPNSSKPGALESPQLGAPFCPAKLRPNPEIDFVSVRTIKGRSIEWK